MIFVIINLAYKIKEEESLNEYELWGIYMVILKTAFLEKVYGEGESKVVALKDTNIEINKGDITVIVGPSGSGKSTLLHLLAGLDKPTTGRVYINGEDIKEMSEKQLARFRRKNIGFIFQFFNLVQILTIEENIKLPLTLDNVKADDSYLEELMKLLNIDNRRKHLPSEVSGGQQQRTAIARALANKPAIIFADEPTGNLDKKNSKEVLELLRTSVKRFSQTLVMITHDPEVAAYADRVIAIEDGTITSDLRRN
jgi:putative ABC transport system ATP-binding protein